METWQAKKKFCPAIMEICKANGCMKWRLYVEDNPQRPRCKWTEGDFIAEWAEKVAACKEKRHMETCAECQKMRKQKELAAKDNFPPYEKGYLPCGLFFLNCRNATGEAPDQLLQEMAKGTVNWDACFCCDLAEGYCADA